jgi:hypothetical protein
VFDGEGSEVRVADEIAGRPGFSEEPGEDVEVARPWLEDHGARCREPGPQDSDGIIERERLRKDGRVRRQPEEREEDRPT